MDYLTIKLTSRQFLYGIGIYFGLTGVVAFFFYRSLVAWFILSPGFFFFLKWFKSSLIVKRKKKLLDEFSETLLSVSINMKSGYSAEKAFLEASKDIELFYGEKSLMAAEIDKMKKGFGLNMNLEELIDDLAKRSGEEEILIFSEVLKSAKRNGGNITEVLLNTADRIRGEICVDKEIDTIISEKKLELRIMEVMPFFIMGYLEVTSVGYFEICYTGLFGRIFMTACLLAYIAAILIGDKILKIKV